MVESKERKIMNDDNALKILDEELEKGRIRHRMVKGGTIDVVKLREAKEAAYHYSSLRIIEAIKKLEKAGLLDILKRLSPRERDILKQRFIERKTLEEVGRYYGVTRERIREIEAKSLKRIRELS